MEFAIWAYPWDLRAAGVEQSISQVESIGIDEINLATNYHSVHSYSPTNSGRRSFFARASAYFQPGDSYGTLAPVPAEPMGDGDWVSEIAAATENSKISLNAWAVGCHNSRLGLDHPEFTIESPHGDSLPFGLCPSHPEVQRYLVELVRDLDSQAQFDRIELETFDFFHGSGLSWHHDKVFVELGALGEFLMGLCFCDDCRTGAATEGVDVESARDECVATLDAIAANQLPASLDPLQWLGAHPEVAAYCTVREQTLVELYDQFRDVIDSDIGYYIGMLDIGDEWMFGANLDSLGDFVDYYTVLAYEDSGEAVADTVQIADELTSETPIHAGLQPGPPIVHDGGTVQDLVDNVIDAGAQRVSFYNYGPLPERSLEWIAESIVPYR